MKSYSFPNGKLWSSNHPVAIVAICFTLCVVLSMGGCLAPQLPLDHDSPLTSGNVKLNLQKGVTTQAQVQETFGAPNLTTRNAQGQEVWTYYRHANVSQNTSQQSALSIILAGLGMSQRTSESGSKTFILVIKFNDKDVVDDFNVRESSF